MNPDHELLAQVLPRYDIRGEIGRGGWGVVYEGWHRDLQRPVAIKQLPRAFGTDPAVRDRFVAEAQLVASLEHPHIVPVYDFAERDGLYVIVMELASGGSVWQRFREHGLRTDQTVATVLATAVGLHHAHSRGMLHRDVKPDNVLYSASGIAKVADFGIAKSMGDTEAGRTATNGLIGTPAYMAPEQVTGGELSAATDVYALGVVLYELLSGQLPFPPVTDSVAQLFQHVHEAPRPLRSVAPETPEPLAAVVARALSKDPADRPATAEDFAVELAAATSEAFGAGWLERSGFTVMGSTQVIAATERTTTSRPRTSETAMVRPEEIEHLRLGQLQSEAHPSVAAAPAGSASAVPAPAGSASAVPAPTVAPAPARSKRPPYGVLAGVGAAIALAIVALVLLVGGGDSTVAPDGTDTVTATERATFLTLCDANGVALARCDCAVGRAIEQLDTEVFRTNLAFMVEQQGELLDEFKAVFDGCLADGF